MTKNHVRPNAHQHTRGDIALRNFNETTQKYKRWVDRWYYNSGVLTCRVCAYSIRDVSDVCLYNGKVMHVECMNKELGHLIKLEESKRKAFKQQHPLGMV